jgi:hypothetical protein
MRGMSVKKLGLIICVCLGISFAGCKSHEKCAPSADNQSVTSKSPMIKKVYVPEYYRYHNGRYSFVKGHYRLVLSPKAEYKRSLRGYTSHPDYTSIR